MEFRIAQISDDPRGVLTGAFVFSPPPHLPDVPKVLVERFGAENTKLGRHGWAVDSKGLRPRVIEKRGNELWLCFGAEVSFHVLPNTPVRISIFDSDLEGTEIWPPIPRGKAPPADMPDDDAPWPEPPPVAKAEPPKPEPPKVEPPKAEPPRPEPPKVEPVKVEPPPIVGDPPPLKGDPPPNRAVLYILAAVLLLAAGGAAWWFTRPQPEPPPPTPAPSPTPTPTPPPAPAAASPCATPADVMAGKCTPELMNALSAEEQTKLAEGLLALPERRAGDVAVSLLSAAVSRHNHPAAMLALAKLYDPITFREGGPLRAANPTRALELYAKAAEGGLAPATAARQALIDRLKQEAAGPDAAAADRAKQALTAAGIQ